MKVFLLFGILFGLSVLITAQIPQRPFPWHATYTAGSIKPTNFTQSQLDDFASSFYDQWKAVYLRNDCGVGQYYVLYDEEDNSNNSICVSEGQGYGMLITAYMAGYDPDAKNYFDGLYNFYKAHPSVVNSNLMAWNQVAGCIDDPQDGNDGATDGDLDIAYALLLADKQWGSTGSINYFSEALNIINAIKQDDINQSIWTTKLGDWVSSPDDEYNDTRPSDFMLNHFRAFKTVANDSDWNYVIDKCYSLIGTMQTNFSPVTGLLPDFIQNCNTTATPTDPDYLESPYDGAFYYNACRTPWRIATDYLISGEDQAKVAVDKINDWIKLKANNDPEQIKAGYYLNGNDIPDNDYYSGSFVGPLTVSAMVNPGNQTWLNSIYNHLLSLQLADYKYFDNTLKMLSLITVSGNWWSPATLSSVNEDDMLSNAVSIYPNPSNGKFTLELKGLNPKTENVRIEIYDALGKIIYCNTTFKLNSSKKINLNGQTDGIYFAKIYDGLNTYSKIISIQ